MPINESFRHQIRCSKPDSLKGAPIRSLQSFQLQHFVSIRPLTAIIVLCFVIPITIATVVLVWKRRRHCACTSVTIKGRYVSVYTRDVDGDDDSKVTFDLKVSQTFGMKVSQSFDLKVSQSFDLKVSQRFGLKISQSFCLKVSQSLDLQVSQYSDLKVSQELWPEEESDL